MAARSGTAAIVTPMSIRLGSSSIGPDEPPFIIAEMSGNHDGDLTRALAIVDMAADAGAHALKLQTYTADTMTLDVDRDEFRIENPASLWFGRTLHSLYDEAHTPWDWHRAIFDRARERGIECFSSPFDHTAVDFLEELDAPAYKIASFENVDLPLIRRVAETGKPIIMSTGIATFDEIDEAVAAARGAGCDDLVLLKCTSAYPARPDDANLRTIGELQRRYGCQVGLSDHTMGVAVSVAAVALGATVIEKHVTLDRAAGGVDAAFSLEPHELADLVAQTDAARRALGSVELGPSASEASAVLRRRSLYFTADIPAGAPITPANVRSIRPGLGLPPKHLDELLGMVAAGDIERGTPVSWDLVRSA